MLEHIEMLKDKKAVIFDLDGTLIDSMWLWKEIDVEFLARFGYEYPPNLPDLLGGKSFYETAVFFQEYFHLPLSLEEIMDEWNRMAEYKYTHEIELKPGVRSFIQLLKENNIPTGIATSNSRELVEGLLISQNAMAYFDIIVTSGEVKKGKPAPDVYLRAAELLGVSPDSCLVFEDVLEGIQAGKNAGMTVCAVDDEYSAYQIMDKKSCADWYLIDFCKPEQAQFLGLKK